MSFAIFWKVYGGLPNHGVPFVDFLWYDRVRKQPGGLLNNCAVHMSIRFTESVGVLNLSLGDC